jgi:hypothetical protein
MARATGNSRQAFVGGSGLSAAACHVLLQRFGWNTSGDGMTERDSSVPFLVVNAATWRLIADIFGRVPPSACVTARRVVAGSHLPEVFAIAEQHYVVRNSALQIFGEPWLRSAGAADQSIETRPEGGSSAWISSGRRVAWFSRAHSELPEAARSLIFEFVGGGWVFWAPTGDNTGFVQFVLPDTQPGADACRYLWRSTRLARRAITVEDEWLARAIPCAARVRRHIIDNLTTRCGSAAMRWDPIAGDGTGAALRSSILACAALRFAAAHPTEREAVWRHYGARLTRAFQGHMNACGRYYAEARLSAGWDLEMIAIRQAAAAAAECHKDESEFCYRLQNLSLFSDSNKII